MAFPNLLCAHVWYVGCRHGMVLAVLGKGLASYGDAFSRVEAMEVASYYGTWHESLKEVKRYMQHSGNALINHPDIRRGKLFIASGAVKVLMADAEAVLEGLKGAGHDTSGLGSLGYDINCVELFLHPSADVRARVASVFQFFAFMAEAPIVAKPAVVAEPSSTFVGAIPCPRGQRMTVAAAHVELGGSKRPKSLMTLPPMAVLQARATERLLAATTAMGEVSLAWRLGLWTNSTYRKARWSALSLEERVAFGRCLAEFYGTLEKEVAEVDALMASSPPSAALSILPGHFSDGRGGWAPGYLAGGGKDLPVSAAGVAEMFVEKGDWPMRTIRMRRPKPAAGEWMML